MAIDTSIYNALRPVQIDSPIDNYAKIAQLQQAQSQNKLAQLTLQQHQRGLDADNALASLLVPGAKPEDVVSGLAQKGFGDRALAYQKQVREQQKVDAEVAKDKAAAAKSDAETSGTVMGLYRDKLTTINDPQTAAQWATSMFSDPRLKGMLSGTPEEAVARIPTDPAGFAQWKLQASMNAEKLQSYLLEQAKFAETKRSNLASERTAAGNLAVAQGNLAVSRERLTFDKSQPKGQYDAERGVIVDPRTGVARSVVGQDGQPIAPKDKLTESQGKSTAFAARMQNADSIINDLVTNGVKTPSLVKQGAEGIPLIGGALGVAANKIVASPAQQKMEQAQRDFVNAVLRQESGAAISASEFDNARKQYFPQPGDSPDVIQQKAQNRLIAIEGMKTQSGPGAAKIGTILNTTGKSSAPSSAAIKFLGFE